MCMYYIKDLQCCAYMLITSKRVISKNIICMLMKLETKLRKLAVLNAQQDPHWPCDIKKLYITIYI